MVEKLSLNSKTMKSNKKGSRGPVSRHAKNTKVQNSFGFGGSNSLNWRNENNKNAVNESNNYGYNNHYVANAFYSLIGLPVEIQKKDGLVHEGILETVSSKVEFHLSHVYEKSLKPDNTNKSEKMFKKLIFPFCDVVYCRAPNVDIDFAKRDTLLTDTAITRTTNGNYGERELVQWQPDSSDETISTDLGDHDNSSGWAFDEMMRVNEEEHGVKSTYDSSLSSYMTPLEKGDDEEYRAREKLAEQVAREIQKDPKFKDNEIVDSGVGEEELYSAVSRNASNANNDYNKNNASPNHNNSNNMSNSNNNSPNNDGFTTYTGSKYRAGRHTTTPANVVGPRLQRNNVRNHESANQSATTNHQLSRNHASSPQRSQAGGTSRNNSYPQSNSQQKSQQPQQQQQHLSQQHMQQPAGYVRPEDQRSMPNHQQENIPSANNRTQADPNATTLSYSAIARKKDAALANKPNVIPKTTAPLQSGSVQDVPQTVPPKIENVAPPLNSIDPPAPVLNNVNDSQIQNQAASLEALQINEKSTQPPAWSPEALAAAKQQMILEARKKAGMGQATVAYVESVATTTPTPVTSTTTTSITLSSCEVVPSVTTSATATPSNNQVKPHVDSSVASSSSSTQSLSSNTRSPSNNNDATCKSSNRSSPVRVEGLEKNPPPGNTVEPKHNTAILPSIVPKDQRIRGDENKQSFLMKYGRIQSVGEEKKGSTYKELKDFGEQFKLEPKPKKQPLPKGTDAASKALEPVKTSDIVADAKFDKTEPAEERAEQTPLESKTPMELENTPVSTPTLSQSSSSNITTAVATSSVTVVSTVASVPTTLAVTATTALSSNVEPSSPSRKTSLNPGAKEFTFNPSAKEFNPGKETAGSPLVASPKQSPARQNSAGTPVQQGVPVQHQPNYHGQAVMIHPNGPEVLSPTVQSVPFKQIYAHPYISLGPGGSTVYSIPTVQLNNEHSGTPQLIAAPKSGFISAQTPPGQQMIIVHPNEPYQQVLQANQGQHYYPMQQMIRCVPGHPAGNHVQPTAARVPANFQQDGSPAGYVLSARQHGEIVHHQSVPGNQHQGYHPPQSPGQSSHIQTQYAITHATPNTYLQSPQSPAQITYSQGGNNGPAFRSPSTILSVTGQHHPQQPFVMVTHQGHQVPAVAVPNNQTYVQGQQYGGGIMQNYQSGN